MFTPRNRVCKEHIKKLPLRIIAYFYFMKRFVFSETAHRFRPGLDSLTSNFLRFFAEPSLTVDAPFKNGVGGYISDYFYADVVDKDDFLFAKYEGSHLPLGLHFAEGFEKNIDGVISADTIDPKLFSFFPDPRI
tara:strand:- start:165 stop:566 length:402 start_codon:yes stop_codon:yes gene_type:complete